MTNSLHPDAVSYALGHMEKRLDKQDTEIKEIKSDVKQVMTLLSNIDNKMEAARLSAKIFRWVLGVLVSLLTIVGFLHGRLP